MTTIARAFSRAITTVNEIEILKQIVLLGAAGLFVSLLMLTYGVDLSPGFCSRRLLISRLKSIGSVAGIRCKRTSKARTAHGCSRPGTDNRKRDATVSDVWRSSASQG